MKKSLDELRVLVVDDDLDMRLIATSMLRALGVKEVDEAWDGREAWEMLEASEYELVLCDWAMPEMSGIEVVKKMRASAQYAKTPFIMITAEGARQQIVTAKKAGATDFVIKPYRFEILLKKLKRVFKKLGYADPPSPAS